jgi:N-glycosylase/DNA lyase
MSANKSNLIVILKELLEGKTLTSSDKYWVNTNQYFRTIKNNGIELIEVWKPNILNDGRHKERRLNQTIENIKKAENYLNSLQGIKA